MLSQRELIHRFDWSLLVVLDACRYDVFREVNWIKGVLRKVRSEGSSTVEWVSKTFPEKYDIVYVSANPYIATVKTRIHSYHAVEHFYKVIDVWDFGWDENLQTVPPWNMVKPVLEARKHGKKIVAHFIQPHPPPLKFETFESWALARHQNLGTLGKKKLRRFPTLREAIKIHGKEKVFQAYKENLKLALIEVEKLIKTFTGKIIVTSDHGESFGENGVYSHPPFKHIPVLVEVPWLEVTSSKSSESPTSLKPSERLEA